MHDDKKTQNVTQEPCGTPYYLEMLASAPQFLCNSYVKLSICISYSNTE